MRITSSGAGLEIQIQFGGGQELAAVIRQYVERAAVGAEGRTQVLCLAGKPV